MLTYTLDKQAGLSLYEQLYRRVKADILSGRLAAGEKLPSKRALAAHLEVSVITVKNAYEQLMAEGYLTGVEKKGYFVSAVLPSPAALTARSPAHSPVRLFLSCWRWRPRCWTARGRVCWARSWQRSPTRCFLCIMS